MRLMVSLKSGFCAWRSFSFFFRFFSLFQVSAKSSVEANPKCDFCTIRVIYNQKIYSCVYRNWGRVLLLVVNIILIEVDMETSSSYFKSANWVCKFVLGFDLMVIEALRISLFQGCGVYCVCCVTFGLYSQEMLLMLVFNDEQVITLYWPSKKDRGSGCSGISKFVDKFLECTFNFSGYSQLKVKLTQSLV